MHFHKNDHSSSNYSQSILCDLVKSLGLDLHGSGEAIAFKEKNGDGEVIVELTHCGSNFLIHSSLSPHLQATHMTEIDLHRALSLNMHVDVLRGTWIGVDDKTNSLRLCATASVRDAEVESLKKIVLLLAGVRKDVSALVT